LAVACDDRFPGIVAVTGGMVNRPWHRMEAGGVGNRCQRRSSMSAQKKAALKKAALSDSDFAFPDERKEPLTDAAHVRSAVSRFNQVEGVSEAERDRAWKRITAAARKFDVELSEESWREIGS
jgi:hypothetical protein